MAIVKDEYVVKITVDKEVYSAGLDKIMDLLSPYDLTGEVVNRLGIILKEMSIVE